MIQGLRLSVVLTLLLLTGCRSFERLAMRVVFEPSFLPAERERHDVPYRAGTEADAEKHRLDVFLPAGEGWPTLVFVHGGSWIEGDKDLTFGGQEVYGNIGRFYANRGLGVVVINYRLQPAVTWRQQVDDVAAAIAWVSREIEGLGGDPRSIFLSGHSAGAQLAAFVVAADEPLRRHGVDRRAICGVISISGAGLDLADQATYDVGADPAFYERTFRDDPMLSDGEWQRRASAVHFLARPGERWMPAFLIFFGEQEHAAFPRQASLLDRAAAAAGLESEVIEVPKASHKRIVAEFSQSGGGLDAAVLAFIEAHGGCADRARSSS